MIFRRMASKQLLIEPVYENNELKFTGFSVWCNRHISTVMSVATMGSWGIWLFIISLYSLKIESKFDKLLNNCLNHYL